MKSFFLSTIKTVTKHPSDGDGPKSEHIKALDQTRGLVTSRSFRANRRFFYCFSIRGFLLCNISIDGMKCRFFKAELCRISEGKITLLYLRRCPPLLAVAQKLPHHLKWDEDLWKTGLGVRFEAADRCNSAAESSCSESCGEAKVRVSIFRLCPLPVSLPHNRKQVFPCQSGPQEHAMSTLVRDSQPGADV